MVQPANVQDRVGAKAVLAKAKLNLKRLKRIWADGGYTGSLLDWVRATCGWTLEIVEKPLGLNSFQALPKRWVVERTFGWLNHYRLLAKEYELLPQTSEASVYAALSHLMLRRLCA